LTGAANTDRRPQPFQRSALGSQIAAVGLDRGRTEHAASESRNSARLAPLEPGQEASPAIAQVELCRCPADIENSTVAAFEGASRGRAAAARHAVDQTNGLKGDRTAIENTPRPDGYAAYDSRTRVNEGDARQIGDAAIVEHDPLRHIQHAQKVDDPVRASFRYKLCIGEPGISDTCRAFEKSAICIDWAAKCVRQPFAAERRVTDAVPSRDQAVRQVVALMDRTAVEADGAGIVELRDREAGFRCSNDCSASHDVELGQSSQYQTRRLAVPQRGVGRGGKKRL